MLRVTGAGRPKAAAGRRCYSRAFVRVPCRDFARIISAAIMRVISRGAAVTYHGHALSFVTIASFARTPGDKPFLLSMDDSSPFNSGRGGNGRTQHAALRVRPYGGGDTVSRRVSVQRLSSRERDSSGFLVCICSWTAPDDLNHAVTPAGYCCPQSSVPKVIPTNNPPFFVFHGVYDRK